jgi:hypothetical protein
LKKRKAEINMEKTKEEQVTTKLLLFSAEIFLSVGKLRHKQYLTKYYYAELNVIYAE